MWVVFCCFCQKLFSIPRYITKLGTKNNSLSQILTFLLKVRAISWWSLYLCAYILGRYICWNELLLQRMKRGETITVNLILHDFHCLWPYPTTHNCFLWCKGEEMSVWPCHLDCQNYCNKILFRSMNCIKSNNSWFT